MNPLNKYHIDAIIFSPHKFIGGISTPGILIIKKYLTIHHIIPYIPRGGTVYYVNNNSHIYLQNLYEKAEGGTQDIIGAIKISLLFQLKHQIGIDYILNLEYLHYQYVFKF